MSYEQPESDLDVVKDMLKKHIHLDTISFQYLYEFEERIKRRGNLKTTTVRSRFRASLNKANELGYCKKHYTGTNYYQTGDNFGGKVCMIYTEIEFHKLSKQ